MQTRIDAKYDNNPQVAHAESILRKCVHCGFCLATCPTYNLLGDELDSPRGRIYQIKQVLEGNTPTASTQLHLDRCLTCRNCETTCPSGVEYGQLVDIGREIVEEQVQRPPLQRLMRKLVQWVLPYSNRVTPLVRLGQAMRVLTPAPLRNSIPVKRDAGQWPQTRHARTMLVLEGCAQPAMAPATNAAMARVLDRLGISLRRIEQAGCCGAINYHLNNQDDGKQWMRANIDAWWPAIEAGAEAIVVTASGCGVMVKDYGHVLRDDPEYRERAARVAELAKDPSEVLVGEDLSELNIDTQRYGRVAFHPPCTLQHGQKLPGVTERILTQAGFELTPITDSHTCCGSAGTYSLFQRKLSAQLKQNKLQHILAGEPSVIATANIGCQLHLQSGTGKTVYHWIELLDPQ